MNLSRSNSVERSSSMGTSPRMAPLTSTLKKNVILFGSFDDSLRLSYRGPGSYFPDDSYSITSSTTSPLRRKSFNVRVQDGNSSGKQFAQRYLSYEQQKAQAKNLASPIKVPNSKRGIKKAWSIDSIPRPSTPSRGNHQYQNNNNNNSSQYYSQQPISQPHTPINLSTTRPTPYRHSSEHTNIKTPRY